MGEEELAVESDFEGADAVVAALVSGDFEAGEFGFQRLSQLLKLGPVVSLLAISTWSFMAQVLSQDAGGGTSLYEKELYPRRGAGGIWLAPVREPDIKPLDTAPSRGK